MESHLKQPLGSSTATLLQALKPHANEAIRQAERHGQIGIELPAAHLVCGKMHALWNEQDEALVAYCRGLSIASTDDSLREEIRSIHALQQDSHGQLNQEILRRSSQLLRIGRLRVLAQDEERITENNTGTVVATNAREEMVKAVRRDRQVLVDRLLAERMRVFTMDAPVVFVAGAGDWTQSSATKARELLAETLLGYRGTIVSGGTTTGIPGCLGDVHEQESGDWQLIGYAPRGGATLIDRDLRRYDAIVETDAADFSVAEPLQAWIDLMASGFDPRSLRLLAVAGGGPISRLECCIALAMGARVGVVTDFGGTACMGGRKVARRSHAGPRRVSEKDRATVGPDPHRLSSLKLPSGDVRRSDPQRRRAASGHQTSQGW